MSTKKEIYYRFIFPDYNSLSGSDSDPIPTSDGTSQIGEVRSLCRACPSRVITYDQLAASTPITMYANSWSAAKRASIKKYIDEYLKIPKYFNLRNYWDANACQEGGMSLMISDSPEVGGDQLPYTKFSIDDKIIYCAVIVSSGDFFYNFCLPDEVIEKSGLRDKIVTEQFHSNWFISTDDQLIQRTVPRAILFNNSDYVYCNKGKTTYSYIYDPNYPKYPYDGLMKFYSPKDVNPIVDTEKRVFVQKYFSDFFQYGLQGGGTQVTEYANFSEDLKRDFIALEATRRILYYNSDTTLKNPNNEIVKITSTSDIPIIDTSISPKMQDGVAQGFAWWRDAAGGDYITPIQINKYNDNINKWEEVTVYTKSNYAANNCAVLRKMSKLVTTQLINNIDELGKNTATSYEPPDVYRTDEHGCPPLQIPYNLLRYAMNDRPPFTDCETVLVMWVADKDPMSTDIKTVADLHNCNFEQYAVPISVRCCSTDSIDHIHDRFLVDYPRKWSIIYKDSNRGVDTNKSRLAYRYHTRRAESTTFPEVMYLQDLAYCSNDYILVYQNSSYISNGFDIQGYILKNYIDSFEKLYVLKTYCTPDPPGTGNGNAASNNQNGQLYYIRVNEKDSANNKVFDVNTTDYNATSNRRICICEPGSTTIFKPSDKIYRKDIKGNMWHPTSTVAPSRDVSVLGVTRHWNLDDVNYHETYGYNDWRIDDKSFITFFNANYKVNNNPVFTRLENCELELVNSQSLYSILGNEDDRWDDIYISSLGVTRFNPVLIDAIFHGGQGNTIYSIGVLDNHIKLNGKTYGSSTSNDIRKIVVGFANMLDFHIEDLYHFKYINNEYKSVKTTFNSTTWKENTVENTSLPICTAYVVDYKP